MTRRMRATGTEAPFRDGMLRLDAEMPPPTRIRSCVTCLVSDCSPAGHGLMEMLCHRDNQEQYLAVRSTWDHRSGPIAELVMETYVGPEHQRRSAGTGDRG